MLQFNERVSIESDLPDNKSMPEIDGGKSQLLLIYEASAKMYSIELKNLIVKYLGAYSGVSDIEVYTNSSIYFKVNSSFSSDSFNKLNTDFENYVKTLEADTKGKMFWFFNFLATYTGPPRKIGIVGRGNKSFHDHFAGRITDLLHS